MSRSWATVCRYAQEDAPQSQPQAEGGGGGNLGTHPPAVLKALGQAGPHPGRVTPAVKPEPLPQKTAVPAGLRGHPGPFNQWGEPMHGANLPQDTLQQQLQGQHGRQSQPQRGRGRMPPPEKLPPPMTPEDMDAHFTDLNIGRDYTAEQLYDPDSLSDFISGSRRDQERSIAEGYPQDAEREKRRHDWAVRWRNHLLRPPEGLATPEEINRQVGMAEPGFVFQQGVAPEWLWSRTHAANLAEDLSHADHSHHTPEQQQRLGVLRQWLPQWNEHLETRHQELREEQAEKKHARDAQEDAVPHHLRTPYHLARAARRGDWAAHSALADWVLENPETELPEQMWNDVRDVIGNTSRTDPDHARSLETMRPGYNHPGNRLLRQPWFQQALEDRGLNNVRLTANRGPSVWGKQLGDEVLRRALEKPYTGGERPESRSLEGTVKDVLGEMFPPHQSLRESSIKIFGDRRGTSDQQDHRFHELPAQAFRGDAGRLIRGLAHVLQDHPDQVGPVLKGLWGHPEARRHLHGWISENTEYAPAEHEEGHWFDQDAVLHAAREYLRRRDHMGPRRKGEPRRFGRSRSDACLRYEEGFDPAAPPAAPPPGPGGGGDFADAPPPGPRPPAQRRRTQLQTVGPAPMPRGTGEKGRRETARAQAVTPPHLFEKGYRVRHDEPEQFVADFEVAGKPFRFVAEADTLNEHEYEIKFRPAKRGGEENYKATGDMNPADAMRVFRHAAALMTHLVRERRPETFYFSADKNEPARVRLYDLMSHQVQRTSGYELNRLDRPGAVRYVFTWPGGERPAESLPPVEWRGEKMRRRSWADVCLRYEETGEAAPAAEPAAPKPAAAPKPLIHPPNPLPRPRPPHPGHKLNSYFDQHAWDLAHRIQDSDRRAEAEAMVGRNWVGYMKAALRDHGVKDPGAIDDAIQAHTVRWLFDPGNLFAGYDEAKHGPPEARWRSNVSWMAKDVARRRPSELTNFGDKKGTRFMSNVVEGEAIGRAPPKRGADVEEMSPEAREARSARLRERVRKWASARPDISFQQLQSKVLRDNSTMTYLTAPELEGHLRSLVESGELPEQALARIGRLKPGQNKLAAKDDRERVLNAAKKAAASGKSQLTVRDVRYQIAGARLKNLPPDRVHEMLLEFQKDGLLPEGVTIQRHAPNAVLPNSDRDKVMSAVRRLMKEGLSEITSGQVKRTLGNAKGRFDHEQILGLVRELQEGGQIPREITVKPSAPRKKKYRNWAEVCRYERDPYPDPLAQPAPQADGTQSQQSPPRQPRPPNPRPEPPKPPRHDIVGGEKIAGPEVRRRLAGKVPLAPVVEGLSDAYSDAAETGGHATMHIGQLPADADQAKALLAFHKKLLDEVFGVRDYTFRRDKGGDVSLTISTRNARWGHDVAGKKLAQMRDLGGAGPQPGFGPRLEEAGSRTPPRGPSPEEAIPPQRKRPAAAPASKTGSMADAVLGPESQEILEQMRDLGYSMARQAAIDARRGEPSLPQGTPRPGGGDGASGLPWGELNALGRKMAEKVYADAYHEARERHARGES